MHTSMFVFTYRIKHGNPLRHLDARRTMHWQSLSRNMKPSAYFNVTYKYTYIQTHTYVQYLYLYINMFMCP